MCFFINVIHLLDPVLFFFNGRRRGFALESAAARVCREAGGRVTTSVLVQDMDLLPLRQVDNRRPEVVVDGPTVQGSGTGHGHHHGVSR